MGLYVLAAAFCNCKVQNKSGIMIICTSPCSRSLEVPGGFHCSEIPSCVEVALGMVPGLCLQSRGLPTATFCSVIHPACWGGQYVSGAMYITLGSTTLRNTTKT